MRVLSRCEKAKPAPYSFRKVEVRTCQVVRPGIDGIGALGVATAAAMPRRASRLLSLICACSPLICDWKAALMLWTLWIMACGPKLVAARLPLASVVTNDVGPDCAARLAAEVMPGMR